MLKRFVFFLLFSIFFTPLSVFAGSPSINSGQDTSSPSYPSTGYWLSDPWDLSSITNATSSFIEYCVCARNGANVVVKTAITTSTSTPSDSSFTVATSSTSIPGISSGDNLNGKYLWLKIEMTRNFAATGTPCLCRINLGIDTTGTTTPRENTLQRLIYSYDAVGNISRLQDVSGTAGYKTVVYTYDDLHRLTSASTTAAETPYKQTFTYDVIGNLLTASSSGIYTYAETNYANPHAVTSLSGTSYAYDNNGNLITEGSKSYGWNYRDRLVANLVSSATTTTYGYDHADARVWKTRSTGSGQATTTYASKYYDIESSVNGATTTATTTAYIWANDTLVATIVGTSTGTSTNYIRQDHLNSTTVTVDEDGDVLSTKDYFPYGSERVKTGNSSLNRGYIGEFEEGNNLSYLNARFYQSDRGQFLSQDPVFWEQPNKQNLENPQSLNSYSYAEGNPIIKKDPTGRCAGFVGAIACGLFMPNVAYAPTNEDFQNPALEGAITVGSFISAGGRTQVAKETASLTSRGIQVIENQAQGKAGEVASGIVKNTQRIPSVTGTAQYRIPDSLDLGAKSMGEVKNVARQSLTGQLKDFLGFAQQSQLQFTLFTRESTQLSKPLQEALKNTGSTIKTLPKKEEK